MGLRIATNIPSMNAQRTLMSVNQNKSLSFSRLSSGKRIVNASDDAAGLSIANNMEAQIRGINQAQRNANDGISLVQTAEGSMQEVSNILVRLRELGVQAASDTVGQSERNFINQEFSELKNEISRIAESANFNGTPLLNGQGKRDLFFQVGAFAGKQNVIRLDKVRQDVRVESLGLDSTIVTDRTEASKSLGQVDSAILKVNEYRAALGAVQNRLQSASATLGVNSENLATAKSRILDTDIAKESAELVKNNILQTASIAVLSQANQSPAGALKLL